MKFKIDRNQSSKISKIEIIQELENVARHFNYTDFKQDDFNALSKINYYTVYREFGTWDKVMQFLKSHFNEQGIEFTIENRRSKFTVYEMFDEMERIWSELGNRPSRDEWRESNPKMSYDTIYRHFGGWTKACIKFVEYKTGELMPDQVNTKQQIESPKKLKVAKQNSKPKISNSRNINLSVRLKVLHRDSYKCVFCGKSPATDNRNQIAYRS